MTSLSKFQETVLREFSFLCQRGFNIVENDSTRVGFRSDRYEIFVFYGRHSREIGLEFGPIEQTPFGHTSLEPLAAAFDRSVVGTLSKSTPIGTPEQIEKRVHSLAQESRRHIPVQGLESESLWTEVIACANAIAEERFPSISESALHSRFQSMWESNDYQGLVQLFGPLRDCLSDGERNKLDSAEQKLRQ